MAGALIHVIMFLLIISGFEEGGGGILDLIIPPINLIYIYNIYNIYIYSLQMKKTTFDMYILLFL